MMGMIVHSKQLQGRWWRTMAVMVMVVVPVMVTTDDSAKKENLCSNNQLHLLYSIPKSHRHYIMIVL